MSAFDKKKTFTDLQIVNLLEPDAAQRAAKLSGMYYSDTMKDFNMMYWSWKKDFRHKYSASYLEKSGFVPKSDAIYIELIPDTVLKMVQLEFPEAISIIKYRLDIPSSNEIARYFLQDNDDYEWNGANSTLNHDGKVYTKLTSIFTNDVLNFTYSEPVPDRYSKVTLTFSNDTNETLQIIIDNEFDQDKLAIILFEIEDEEDPIRYYMNQISNLASEFYRKAELEMMAIIPIKEDNVFVNPDLKMKRLLNKYGLSANQLMESLTTNEDGTPSEIDNAYIWNGIGFRRPYQPLEDKPDIATELPGYYHKRYRQKNNYYAEAMYKTFEFFGEGYTGTKSFEVDSLKLSYSFDYDKIEGTGNASTYEPEASEYIDTPIDDYFDRYENEGPIELDTSVNTTLQGKGVPFDLKPGEYYSEVVEDLEYNDLNDANHSEKSPNTPAGSIRSELYIYHQIDEDNYEIIHITNYTQLFSISGYWFTAYLDSLPSEGRLIMPLKIMNDLRFNRFIVVQEFSFSMIAYAKKTVTIKWYQRWFFQFLFAVVIAFLTGGAGVSLATVIINTAIQFGIGMIVQQILAMIDNPLFKAIVGLVIQFLMGSFDFSSITAENFLPLATKVIDAGSTIYQAKLEEASAKAEEMSKQQGYEEREADRHSATTGFPSVLPMSLDAHQSAADRNSPDAFYNSMLGAGLFDFEQYYNVDSQIELRKQVTAG